MTSCRVPSRLLKNSEFSSESKNLRCWFCEYSCLEQFEAAGRVGSYDCVSTESGEVQGVSVIRVQVQWCLHRVDLQKPPATGCEIFHSNRSSCLFGWATLLRATELRESVVDIPPVHDAVVVVIRRWITAAESLKDLHDRDDRL